MSRSGGLPSKALATWAGIILVVAVVSRLAPPSSSVPPDVVAAALFLYVPLFHYYGHRSAPSWTRVGDPWQSAAVLAALLAAGAAVYAGYSRLPLPQGAAPPHAAAMPPAGDFLVRQALLAAIPEEVFFRGYLYDAFEERGREPIVLTSALFAAGHLAIHASPWRAMTFFPALLFGWARRKTGNVYVPALLHIAFNSFQYLPGI